MESATVKTAVTAVMPMTKMINTGTVNAGLRESDRSDTITALIKAPMVLSYPSATCLLHHPPGGLHQQ